VWTPSQLEDFIRRSFKPPTLPASSQILRPEGMSRRNFLGALGVTSVAAMVPAGLFATKSAIAAPSEEVFYDFFEIECVASSPPCPYRFAGGSSFSLAAIDDYRRSQISADDSHKLPYYAGPGSLPISEGVPATSLITLAFPGRYAMHGDVVVEWDRDCGPALPELPVGTLVKLTGNGDLVAANPVDAIGQVVPHPCFALGADPRSQAFAVGPICRGTRFMPGDAIPDPYA
jgi:hypothetical protein